MKPAEVGNVTLNPVKSVVAPGHISIDGPITAKPPDTTWWQKLEGSDFWLGEAGAAYVGVAFSTTLGVLTLLLLRRQNAIVERQNILQNELTQIESRRNQATFFEPLYAQIQAAENRWKEEYLTMYTLQYECAAMQTPSVRDAMAYSKTTNLRYEIGSELFGALNRMVALIHEKIVTDPSFVAKYNASVHSCWPHFRDHFARDEKYKDFYPDFQKYARSVGIS